MTNPPHLQWKMCLESPVFATVILTKRSIVHIIPLNHQSVSQALLPTRQQIVASGPAGTGSGDELLFLLFTLSSGWMVSKITGVYLDVTLPWHHAQLSYFIYSKS